MNKSKTRSENIINYGPFNLQLSMINASIHSIAW